MNIAGTATIVDTMPPTTTLRTYPIARNHDRLSGASREELKEIAERMMAQ